MCTTIETRREYLEMLLSKKSFCSWTKLSPPYSNLFMAGLEKRTFRNSEFKPFLWLRCLDEIFDI